MLDADFEPMARAVAAGEFALWVGSGISRRAPNLGHLVSAAIEFLRERAIAPATAAIYTPPLEAALRLAGKDPAALAGRFGAPFATWPEHDEIVTILWDQYSRVLDIRVQGEPADFILWDAIDIRQAFSAPHPPSAEHLCIAILVMEDAVHRIASANWDGFIEAAVDRLSGGAQGLLQVVVDPAQLRGQPGRATLLKFHGCIVHATDDPATFRRFLTGSRSQIMRWPEVPEFAAMRHSVIEVAQTLKSLVLGLSIQDNNLQTLFIRAQQIHPWPWPCAPEAPAQVFCEEEIKPGQQDVLRSIYVDAYDQHGPDIEAAAHLRAWAEQVLIALVLKTVADKLITLMGLWLTSCGKAALAPAFANGIVAVRNAAAAHASVDSVERSRTPAVNTGVAAWSRMVRMFRNGALPASGDTYEPVSATAAGFLHADQNAQSAGLGRLALALSLLEGGRAAGRWAISPPANDEAGAGAMTATPARPGATPRPVFVVRSASEAIALQGAGAFANDNAVVVHGDDAWRTMVGQSARVPRGAPGRTGRLAPTHVSLAHLVSTSATAVDLQDLFAAEMLL